MSSAAAVPESLFLPIRAFRHSKACAIALSMALWLRFEFLDFDFTDLSGRGLIGQREFRARCKVLHIVAQVVRAG